MEKQTISSEAGQKPKVQMSSLRSSSSSARPRPSTSKSGRSIYFLDTDPRKLLERQTYVSVSFKALINLTFGEELVLVGSSPTLGNWKVNFGIKLDTNPKMYPTWTTINSVPIRIGEEVTYRYAVLVGGEFRRWEAQVEPRTLFFQEFQENVVISDVLEKEKRENSAENSPPEPKLLHHGVFEEDSEESKKEKSALMAKATEERIIRKNSGETENNPFSSVLSKPRTLDQKTDSNELEMNDGFVIVTYFLPVLIEQDTQKDRWVIEWDYDALFSRKEQTAADNLRVHFVGCPRLKSSIQFSPPGTRLSQESLTIALRKFRCVPVYVSAELHESHFAHFCCGMLRKVMHNIVDIYHVLPYSWEEHWRSYSKVNQMFCDKLLEIFCEGDLVWINLNEGFELMLLASYIARKMQSRVHLGYLVNNVWASSEIFKTLPYRLMILRAMLNADHVAFHTFEDARRFLSCCKKVLGLDHTFENGVILIDSQQSLGRKVVVSVSHAGVVPGFIFDKLKQDSVKVKREELKQEIFQNLVKGVDNSKRTLVVGVDKLDGVSGVYLKLLAYEQLLKTWDSTSVKELNKPIFVQVLMSTDNESFLEKARDCTEQLRQKVGTTVRLKEVENRKKRVQDLAKRINDANGADFVKIIERERFDVEYRLALFSLADVMMQTPTREGFNLIPFEYILSHDLSNEKEHPLMIMSEFSANGRVFRGSIKINPWRIQESVDSIIQALVMSSREKKKRYMADYEFVLDHVFLKWLNLLLQDLKKARSFSATLPTSVGFGHTFKSIGLKQGFRSLDSEKLGKWYKATSRRLILLDYTGTLVPEDSSKVSKQVRSEVQSLCDDVRNTVFIISGREKEALSSPEAFGGITKLGMAAEHGFYYYNPTLHEWENLVDAQDASWKDLAHNLLKLYTKRTVHSKITVKGSTLLWDYTESDPEFGEMQGMELKDHLQSLLSKYNVEVYAGKNYVEVHPQGCGKDKAVQYILNKYFRNQSPDFILCAGDDVADERMFEFLGQSKNTFPDAKIFTVVVGQKPSAADFFVDNQKQIEGLLSVLAKLSNRQKFSRSLTDIKSLSVSMPKKSAFGDRNKSFAVPGGFDFSQHSQSSVNLEINAKTITLPMIPRSGESKSMLKDIFHHDDDLGSPVNDLNEEEPIFF